MRAFRLKDVKYKTKVVLIKFLKKHSLTKNKTNITLSSKNLDTKGKELMKDATKENPLFIKKCI